MKNNQQSENADTSTSVTVTLEYEIFMTICLFTHVSWRCNNKEFENRKNVSMGKLFSAIRQHATIRLFT